MSYMDNIHDAIKELYPNAQIAFDYIWEYDYSQEPPVPRMSRWNTDKFGPLDMNAIEQKCQEIENRVATPSAPSTPTIIAMGELRVIDFDVTGIETATGLAAAFFLDTGVILIYFNNIQPNTAYLAFPQCPGFYADVTAREVDYFEVTVTDRTTNQPAMPGSLSISVQRVK